MQTVLEVARIDHGGCPELEISGRMDSYWARHVSEAIEELMREGARQARLNLSKTTYLSSAGIRVLVQAFQEFAAIGGTLLIVEPSPGVRQVLELAGLGMMMREKAADEVEPQPSFSRREEAGCTIESRECVTGASLLCRIAGHPEPLISEGFAERDCEMFYVSHDMLSLGLGAFGEGYEDSRERFGEFVAVAGCAACQPTDESGYADYVVSSSNLVPKLATLYSISCKGPFKTFLQFDCHPRNGPIGFAQMVTACIEAAKSPVAGMVMLAECTGVLGASLKRSPVSPHEALFHHPQIRQWLSFSPVRSSPRSVLLVAGVAAQQPCPAALAPLVRAVKRNCALVAHFHAAVFAYRPLRKGYMELGPAVEHLFDGGGLQGVLHLMADDRTGSGLGETEFTRGACWVGPISRILTAEETL